MAENEKLERVKEKLAANKGRIILVGGFVFVVLGASILNVHHREAALSNIGQSRGVQTDSTKLINQNYQKILQKDDRQKYQQALAASKSGQIDSTIPSLIAHETPPPNNSLLTMDSDEGATAQKPVPLPEPNKNKPPEQKKAPDIELPLPTPPKPIEKPHFQQQSLQQQQQMQLAERADEGQELNYQKDLIHKVIGANKISIGYSFKSSSSNTIDMVSGGGNRQKDKWNAGTQASFSQTKLSNAENNPANFVNPAPGTVMDAEMVAQVTSYSNGPVFAQIVSGKYAGARLIGSFSPDQNQLGLQLKFKTMTIPYEDENGDTQTQSVSINAIGVAQGTMANSVATSVNRHFLLRASYQLASSFMQGLGEAIQQSGSSATTTTGGTTMISQGKKNLTQEMLQAGGQAASNMQSQMQQMMGPYTQTEIKIAQGTPFQIVFMPGSNSQ